MAFDFSFMTTKSRTAKASDNTPLIKIFNMSRTAQASYMFLNATAVKALNLQKDDMVRIGIDKETRKIVIIPTSAGDGRRLSKNPSGSGTISISNLIDKNGIPTQTCTAAINKNYVRGGLIFTYETSVSSEPKL